VTDLPTEINNCLSACVQEHTGCAGHTLGNGNKSSRKSNAQQGLELMQQCKTELVMINIILSYVLLS
jgi:hypothetical protein